MKFFRSKNKGGLERKQLEELTWEDLKRCPVWEFSIDEELEENEGNEHTMRPRPDVSSLEWATTPQGEKVPSIFGVVTAQFYLGDRSMMYGYVRPSLSEEIGFLQPTILVPDGQVGFWYGMFPPSREEIAAAYGLLRKEADAVFPIHYHWCVTIGEEIKEGSIAGFAYLDRKQGLAVKR